jgi:hypothetical protein
MRHRSGTSEDDEMVSMAGAIAILSGRQRPMHHTTLYRGIKAGRFPAPIRIGPGSVRWLRSELVAVRDRMIAERDGRVL